MRQVLACDFETLLSLWSQDRRAKGGWWALAGFSFQSVFYLLRFFEGIQNGSKSPADLAKTELLSDILVPKDGVYTLTQVKRTLDRTKLAAALREAYEIASLCDAALLTKLRFRVACLQRKPSALLEDFTVQEVVGLSGDLETWERMLKCFNDPDAIVEEPDPLDHLHDFLWHTGIRDTTGFIDNCLGILLRLFANPSQESITQIARELSHEFYLARQAGPGPTDRIGLPLRRSDVELQPEADSDRGIAFNRRPQLLDLQLGRYRTRRDIFLVLVQEFEVWWRGVKTAEEVFRVPIFWIEGRSGEGKSVLLLQLAQHVLTGIHSPVVSYLGSAAALPDWIKNQVDLQRGQPQSSWLPAIAIVDDLHLIRDREEWEIALREATGLMPPEWQCSRAAPAPLRSA